ncbi:hypothetical protein COY62_02325 [bacterium (Candidatus Howlettbacteria) CG_4_10_14_0_8_um_filter_40_9]|nr:MAG: hypothetical protein COY62_02325 [bacterium (Candidatus Howlettbacteria) CG_4_10_14_0_8_um_filter_40_9]
MTNSDSNKRLAENWVGIVLTVISIIQGLAFNNLVTRFPKIYAYTLATLDPKIVMHFVLSFILLLRVFQTYVTAAIDYNDWTPRFFDIILIFVVGALEYFLFAALTTPVFDVKSFHLRLITISGFGLIGYLNALVDLRNKSSLSEKMISREIGLQFVNIMGVIAVMSISGLIIFAAPLTDNSYSILALLAILMLVFNIIFSLTTTFPKRRTSKLEPQ